jgi:hypothetical protein
MESLSREEVRQRLVRVCKQLTTLVAGSYGPLGRAQLLQANAQCPDALTATSVAERYLANLKYGRLGEYLDMGAAMKSVAPGPLALVAAMGGN